MNELLNLLGASPLPLLLSRTRSGNGLNVLNRGFLAEKIMVLKTSLFLWVINGYSFSLFFKHHIKACDITLKNNLPGQGNSPGRGKDTCRTDVIVTRRQIQGVNSLFVRPG